MTILQIGELELIAGGYGIPRLLSVQPSRGPATSDTNA